MKQVDMVKEIEDTDRELEKLLTGKAPETDKPLEPSSTENTGKPEEGKTSDEAPVIPAQPTPDVTIEKLAEAIPADTTDYKVLYDALKAEFDRLTHAHAVLQGKTYAEVPRVNAENKALKETGNLLQTQIEENDRIIADLQGKLAEKPTAPAKVTTGKNFNAVIEGIRDQHGDEFADSMVELVQPFEAKLTEAAGTVNALKAEIAELRKAKSETSTAAPVHKAEDPMEKFYIGVFEAVPDWLDINGDQTAGKQGDPRFYNFLDTIEPNSRMPYRKLAMSHQEAGNVDGFSKVFQDFKKSIGGTTPTVTPPTPGFSKEVEQHLEPSTVGGTSTTKDKPKTYTRKEVDDFFNTLTRKGPQALNLTQAEILTKQREYDQAEVEGRVIG